MCSIFKVDGQKYVFGYLNMSSGEMIYGRCFANSYLNLPFGWLQFWFEPVLIFCHSQKRSNNVATLSFDTSYNKATNSVIAKRTYRHARVACYTFSERSWHADPQSMEKWVTPLKAVPLIINNQFRGRVFEF